MALGMDTVRYGRVTVGTLGDDLFHDSGVSGFGRGLHRLAAVDRLVGGQHVGRSVPGPRVIELDCWTDRLGGLADLAVEMEASVDLRPLLWRGMGWGDRELACWVAPAAVDWDVGESVLDGVVEGVRCQWLAPDPTVYDAEATVFSGSASASTPLSRPWTNPGRGAPAVGLGGRAWTVEVTAGSTARGVWIDQGPGTPRVEFRGAVLPAGATLAVGADRVPTMTVAGQVVPVVAWRLAEGWAWVPDPIWPRYRGGQPSQLRVGCTSGSLAVTGELRGTWS